MFNYCETCGHIGGHAYGCPEAPEQKPIYTCSECDGEIFAGDTVFKVGTKYLCCECCSGPYEAEAPDQFDYEDYLIEKYERTRHDE